MPKVKNQKRVMLLNGPPGSGKDYLVQTMLMKTGHTLPSLIHLKFADFLKRAVLRLYGIMGSIHYSHYEGIKDKPLPEFLDKTFRELLIKLSEGFYKPVYGKTFFGEIIGRKIVNLDSNVIVSDLGFREELHGMLDFVPVEDVCIVQLAREGKTFKGDSRKYVRYNGIKTIKVVNDGSPEGFKEAAREAFSQHEDLAVFAERLS